jgi:hypothetical protein
VLGRDLLYAEGVAYRSPGLFVLANYPGSAMPDRPFTLKALHNGRELYNAYSVTDMIGAVTQGRPFDELRANPGLQYITALRYGVGSAPPNKSPQLTRQV